MDKGEEVVEALKKEGKRLRELPDFPFLELAEPERGRLGEGREGKEGREGDERAGDVMRMEAKGEVGFANLSLNW